MAIQKFINNIKMHASMATNAYTYPSVGQVTAYDPDNYLVQVQLQVATSDSPALATGWIPLASPWVGNGWGMFAPPSIGDIIEVHYQEGSLVNAFACLKFYGDPVRPLSVPSGEFWLVHKTGSFVKFTNDGNVSISSSTKIDITAPIVNITASTSISLRSPSVKMGDLDGPLQPILLADNSPSANVEST